MDIVIGRYKKFFGNRLGPYMYYAKVGTVTLESPNILDLEVFLGLSGHTIQLSFINEVEHE